MVETSLFASTAERRRIQITGVVQGVGFRPFVFRLAVALNLTGWVCNGPEGVVLEVQGYGLAEFIDKLTQESPPSARIERVTHQSIPIAGNEEGFQILPSLSGNGRTHIAADRAVCSECLGELFNSSSRFFQYPFINCSHCGPRYTLTHALPYDRPQTSMADFKPCQACLTDYHQPDNRRYHTESIACTGCGPQYSQSIAQMAELIKEGKILAVKNSGGYQLICDARKRETVNQLRQRKHRADKPFALMVLNIKSAAQIVEINDRAIDFLTSSARPIVLLPEKDSQLSGIIAPKLTSLGVMLPSAPLHYLLFYYLMADPLGLHWLDEPASPVLVVTSANMRGEPLIKANSEAMEKLPLLADQIIHHSRDIVVHADDSVIGLIKNKSILIRRASGYVPEPVLLRQEIPPILGLGGHLKNTICITRGKEAFISQHIGDLNTPSGIRCYHATLSHLLKLLNVKPDGVAHDENPDFYTTQLADSFGVPVYPVQHHHAHIGSVAAEHHWNQPALGLALDGFGLGENQQHWGGELLLYQGSLCTRLASLRPLAQPGGDRAAQQPWRMAASALYAMGWSAEILRRFPDQPHCRQLITLLERQIHCPPTSSCGRLFDAASALLGICLENHYEGQAALQMEALVNQPKVLTDGWIIHLDQLDLLPTLRYLLDCDPVNGADIFHGTLAAALVEWVMQQSKILQIKTVLLSGGCFLNRVLIDLLLPKLIAAGLIPLLPKQLPPHDGGLSLGQVWVAAHKI